MGIVAAGMVSPLEEYRRRHALRQAEASRWARLDLYIANARLTLFAAAALIALAWLAAEALPGWALLLPGALFLLLVVAHELVIRRGEAARAAAAHWQRGIDRLEGRWQGRGVVRSDLAPESHPYAADLDLFGPGSLFDLLCTARTRIGEEALARWLLAPASLEALERRHGALLELRGRLELREDLALAGGTVRDALHPDVLLRWSEAPPAFSPAGMRALRLSALALALAALGTLALWAWAGTGPVPFLLVVAAEWLLARLTRDRIGRITAAVSAPGVELELLAEVLGRLERESLRSPLGAELSALLGSGRRGARRAIASLGRRVSWLDAQRNQLFAPIALVALWSIQFGLAVEAWRLRHGRELRGWLEALGAIEALLALAAYAYEHPDDVLPEIAPGAARFDASALGHPLLPEASCVRNDISIGGSAPHLFVVSGSNMSGKSTMLRTVGANVVLALAGAPVRAARLCLTPLAVGATLRIHDSIQEGRSRFYAEIERLRQLVELSRGAPPLLFLLDEIFHGTNSHDRRIGAEAVCRALVEAGAVGLVTTHDLALAELAHAVPGAENVHFADRLENGRLIFDYRLARGVVARSNAIELMRSVGLPV